MMTMKYSTQYDIEIEVIEHYRSRTVLFFEYHMVVYNIDFLRSEDIYMTTFPITQIE